MGSTKPMSGEVLFHITDGTEFATLHADDFRATMLERDHLRTEVERLRAIVDAAFAYVHTPIDDPETGALYRALQVAVTETVENASRAAALEALDRTTNR